MVGPLALMGSLQLEENDRHTSNHKDHSVISVTTFFRVRTRVCPAPRFVGLRLEPAGCIGLGEGLVMIIHLFVYLYVLSPLRMFLCMNLFHKHGLDGQATEKDSTLPIFILYSAFLPQLKFSNAIKPI